MQSIIVVGAGALGSQVVLALRNVNAKLTVMDYDRVEQKNTQSQFYGRAQVGKNKALALAQLMDFLFRLKVDTNPHKLTADNADQVLKDHTLIIDCVDNAEARRVMRNFTFSSMKIESIEVRGLLNVRSSETKFVPLLHGALAADGSFGQAVWDEHFTIDEGATGAATCEDGEHLPFVSVVAGYIAHAARLAIDKNERPSYQIWPHGAQRVG